MLEDIKSRPAGRLVPVFAASEGLRDCELALRLSKAAASLGETVLLLDANSGLMMETAGIIYNKTLGDVIYREAALKDAQYITANEHFTAAACGDAPLEDVLGSLATLSLSYDWVFVATKTGCTPAHVRLASAADTSILSYGSSGDKFMRAYWMIDAVRARYPKFDPLLLSSGPKSEAVESALILTQTVREFLGAPPPYAGHYDDLGLEMRVLGQMREASPAFAVA